jgi:hypothetical protein
MGRRGSVRASSIDGPLGYRENVGSPGGVTPEGLGCEEDQRSGSREGHGHLSSHRAGSWPLPYRIAPGRLEKPRRHGHQPVARPGPLSLHGEDKTLSTAESSMQSSLAGGLRTAAMTAVKGIH